MSTRHIAAEGARLHDLTPEGSSGAASRRFRQRLAADGFTVDEGFRLKPGYLYTVVRAISARVNQNWDGWPSEELRKSYRTFIGKPVFVNHENHDPTKARGVVVAARYAENGMDKYIEVVQEIDANRFPKLAHEIKSGGLDSVSMGAEAGFTICSYCHNKATDMDDMCDHVINHKGKTLSRLDRKTGKREDVLIFESCHKISFFELSYVFEPADETAVASKVVVAGKRTAMDEHFNPNDGLHYRNNLGKCGLHNTGHRVGDRVHVPGAVDGGDHVKGTVVDHDYHQFDSNDGHPMVFVEWDDGKHNGSYRPNDLVKIKHDWNPDDTVDPFDPRIIGAAKEVRVDDHDDDDDYDPTKDPHSFEYQDPDLAEGYCADCEGELGERGVSMPQMYGNQKNGYDMLCEDCHAKRNNWDISDEMDVYRGWNPDDNPGPDDPRIKGANRRTAANDEDDCGHNDQDLLADGDTIQCHDCGAINIGTAKGRAWTKDWNPDDNVDPFDPRIIGAGLRTAEDLTVPAPPGTRTVDQDVIDATPVIELNPATELTGHEAPGVPKGAGKYTKEDFAAAGSRKPWEAVADEDESDALEIEAMIHKHSAECPPGVDCSRNMGLANGMEQITKDSPNNPVNQVSADPNGNGALGGAGTPGGGGYAGNGKSGRDGLNPGAQAFYDQLAKDFPGASLGGFNPVVDQPWDEHATGDALDFMTSDVNQGNTIKDRALENGAKHVIWQQKLWYPGGGVEEMGDRGSPTENHYDHVHINMGGAAPTGGSSASTASGGGSAAAQPMMQATPTGLVPAQRAAALNPPDSMPRLMPTRRAARVAGAHPIPGFTAEPGARPIDFSKPVFVHTNRHAVNHNKKVAEGLVDAPPRADVWSIKQDDPETGVHVRGYAPEVHMVDARFNVQQAGARKFKDTQNPDGTGGQRVVHAGAYGHIAPPPDEPLHYSLTDYHPGFHTTFVHRDNGEPITTADHVHFTPDARMYSAQDDNWGRGHEPALLLEPHPSVSAANPHTVGGEPGDRPPTWSGHTASLRRTARRAAMKKTARTRALRLAWGEKEAPMAVDTLREEGSAPEDDNDDFERYVDPPKELQTPDLSQGESDARDREVEGQGGDMGDPGQADPSGGGPQAPQQQFMTLRIPIPGGAPQVPQAAVPPQSQVPPQQGPITASMLDHFDRYYGRRVANWMDAIEARRGMTPAEAADYRRQAAGFSTLLNDREHSTTNRNPRKGTANMARNSMASRKKVATTGRRQHLAEGPLTDGGDRSRNDQGEQEEVFISQTPPEVRGDYPTDDAANIANTEHNLVARVQRGRAQLLRDAKALAAMQKRRASGEAGGPTAEVVDPRVNTGPEGEALTGTGFVSADPNDGVVPTNPKDASLRAFQAFDGWLTQKTGKSSRRHTEANIKKAAAAFSREAGISPQALFPALGIVLREARKNDKQANTKGAKMRKRSNESLDVAAPDGRVDVEAPVSNTTSAEAQASQFDIHDFGNNAGDDVAKPDLSTDQNWAPGEASKTGARVKTAGGLLAMRCAEGMIAAGLEANSRERKYQLAAEFEGMNRGLIQDRVALLERFAAVRQADLRRVASGSSRGAARSPIPAGLGGGTRTAAAGMRTAAHDPSNDSSLFI